MNSGAPRSGIPTAVIAILATCGGCLVIAVVSAVLLANAAMNSTPVLMGRAGALQSQKRYREAETLLLKAVRNSPKDAVVLNNLAWTYYLDGKHAEGEPYAQRAVALDSTANYVDT